MGKQTCTYMYADTSIARLGILVPLVRQQQPPHGMEANHNTCTSLTGQQTPNQD
jgi:hypothetical protein